MIDYPKVPDGWKSEPVRGCCTLIEWPGHGMVTIDWEARGFRGGFSTTGLLSSKRRYTGRGWKERLVFDAVASLQEVWK